MTDHLTLERADDVFVLTLTNEDNRFNLDSVGAIHDALDEVDATEGPVALVVTGQGKFFSNGLDLDWMTGPGSSSGEVPGFMQRLHGVFLRTLVAPYATAAAVNGHAFAAAAMWVTAFDHRVMRADRGFWCLPEVDLGMPFTPGMMALIAGRLPSVVSHQAVVTGRRYGGVEAAQLSIVDDSAPEDEVLARAVDHAQALADKHGEILGTIKRGRHAATVAALEAAAGLE